MRDCELTEYVPFARHTLATTVCACVCVFLAAVLSVHRLVLQFTSAPFSIPFNSLSCFDAWLVVLAQRIQLKALHTRIMMMLTRKSCNCKGGQQQWSSNLCAALYTKAGTAGDPLGTACVPACHSHVINKCQRESDTYRIPRIQVYTHACTWVENTSLANLQLDSPEDQQGDTKLSVNANLQVQKPCTAVGWHGCKVRRMIRPRTLSIRTDGHMPVPCHHAVPESVSEGNLLVSARARGPMPTMLRPQVYNGMRPALLSTGNPSMPTFRTRRQRL